MTRPWLDPLGAVASAACAAHCMTLALAPALLPLLGLGFLDDEAFEWSFTAVAATVAAAAAWQGRADHRRRWTTAGFALGVATLIGARLTELLELGGGLGLALVGGALLVASHAANQRRSHRCEEAPCAAP